MKELVDTVEVAPSTEASFEGNACGEFIVSAKTLKLPFASFVWLVETDNRADEHTIAATENPVASKRAESVSRSVDDASRKGGYDSTKRHSKKVSAIEGNPKPVQQPDIEGPIRQMLLSARVHQSQKVIFYFDTK